MIKNSFLILILLCFFSSKTSFAASIYLKASEDQEVVKNKLYPKKETFELNVPNVGMILNQSYIQSYLIHGGAAYFFNESWGIGFEGAMSMNTDKPERTCIESFYNDPRGTDVAAECGPPENLQGQANYGPAYVPIREIKMMAFANAIWNPVYGKQLLFMSATNYFDLFVTFGGGLVMSDYYPLAATLKNGKPARGTQISNQPNSVGASGSETNSYGKAGRPTPESQTTPALDAGIGLKYHFAKRFNVRIELRNFTLVGTPDGFESMFALWSGFGIRF